MNPLLNPAEIDILARLAAGGSALTAAHDRGTHPDTVRGQIKLLRSKLGAKNTAHAVAIAIRSGQL